ncbi:sugar transferase [Ruminococcus sp.]|uniref:sugar transferase n=1 Tax=Ruminococcus sp. TaxID=41978 RepID=UPI001B6C375D|nr:sugar transferase [Ruminococcus sp.]MBP5430706.1 sugar transferase [Ruminococcus sp.]
MNYDVNKFLGPFGKSAAIISGISLFVAFIAFIAERADEIKNRKYKKKYRPSGIYERFIKRPLDCFFSTGAFIILSPLMIMLTVVGAVKMKGNPFFTQDRPGRIDPKTGEEKIFKLIKFKSMTDEKDSNGKLLPDEKRLTKYGKFLRSSSCDELGELINIIKGDMSVVGPRPLLVRDMVFMNDKQRERHYVRQGLTGLAQCNGRNDIPWEDKLRYDNEYVDSGITFVGDMKIVLKTFKKVFIKEGIAAKGMATAADLGDYLVSVGKVTQKEYTLKQELAKQILVKQT